jgi:hypothetical protein
MASVMAAARHVVAVERCTSDGFKLLPWSDYIRRHGTELAFSSEAKLRRIFIDDCIMVRGYQGMLHGTYSGYFEQELREGHGSSLLSKLPRDDAWVGKEMKVPFLG